MTSTIDRISLNNKDESNINESAKDYININEGKYFINN